MCDDHVTFQSRLPVGSLLRMAQGFTAYDACAARWRSIYKKQILLVIAHSQHMTLVLDKRAMYYIATKNLWWNTFSDVK